ncbi:MAG: M1 family metallopeptidase [Ignavibacteriaceae bacterium]|nr:M1 family metallopeptidase [Ignavibacteriaceae bacterium]
MQKKIYFAIVSLLVFLLFSNSFSQQELLIPRNIKSAYEKGTRSLDGKPGAEYWQNSADYKIEVEVDPSTYQIVGREVITYYNDSPDSIKRIILRLYPNIYASGNARDYAIAPDAVNDGVTIEKISMDGRSINLENQSIFGVTNTLATIYLPEPIPPKSSTIFSIEWDFYVSTKVAWRMGVYDSTTVFVGYWYPQISVYDDIDGWDYINYGGQVEFYNDFSNFEVSISIPNNFGVWATGELQNPAEVFDQRILERYTAAKESADVVRIITLDDLNSSDIYKNDQERNTWVYKASHVTDFAFALSNHYLWDGLGIVVDSVNNNNIFIQSIYPVDSPDFKEVAKICGELVNYFSWEMPGIIFPVPSFVAFNNGKSGGGMEFPMMINDGSPNDLESTVSLTAHEMAHQYFPFFVGTNEKKYAFMDEAWAVLLPFKYMEEFAGINTRLISTVANYEYLAGTEDDIPPMIMAFSQNYISYRNSAYNRPSIAYEELRDMLGDELFLKALQEYIYRWNGKHPTPYDFFFTFNDVSGQDLTWYWEPWFFENGYPDLAIEKIEVANNKIRISIRRIGNIPTPIKLKMVYENETIEEFHYSAGVWNNNNSFYVIEVEPTDSLKEVQLGDSTIPDSNRENNIYLVH